MVTTAKIIIHTAMIWECFTSNALLLRLRSFVKVNSADPETAEISTRSLLETQARRCLSRGQLRDRFIQLSVCVQMELAAGLGTLFLLVLFCFFFWLTLPIFVHSAPGVCCGWDLALNSHQQFQ